MLKSLPPEIISQIIEKLSLKDLKPLIYDPFLGRYAFNKYYDEVFIAYVDAHPKFDGAKDDEIFTDDEEKEDPNMSRDYGDGDIYGRFYRHLNQRHMKCFDNLQRFIEFCVKNEHRYIPNVIEFEDATDLILLHEVYPRILRIANKIEVSFSNPEYEEYNEPEYVKCLINRVAGLPYNIKALTYACVFSDSHIEFNDLNYPQGLDRLDLVRAELGNKYDFFQYKVNNLSILTLRNVSLEVEDLELLPRRLRKLNIFNSLTIRQEYVKLNLPTSLVEFKIETLKNSRSPSALVKVDISHLKRLKNVVIACASIESLQDIKLPPSIIDLELSYSDKLSDLKGLEVYANLKTLNLNGSYLLSINNALFSKTKFPSSLETLTYSGRLSIEISGNETERLIENLASSNPGDYHFDGKKFYSIIDERLELPPNLNTFVLSNHPDTVIKSAKLRLPQSLKFLSIKSLGGFIDDISDFKLPKTLVRLDMPYMNISSIDKFQFPQSLINLTLSNNSLSTIRNTNLNCLTNLVRLDLDDNKFTTCDSFKDQLPPNLKVLGLINNELTECYDLPCFNLSDLRLSYNKFSGKITDRILSMPDSVRFLSLISNKIESFDEKSFKFPSKLAVLNLTRNEMKILTWDNFFSKLPQNLNSLYLGHNKLIVESDRTIELPSNLRTASFYNNNLTSDLIKKISFRSCNKLNTLLLCSNEIEAFDLNCLPMSIQRFHLTECKLSTLKGTFENFTNLKEIDISGNKLGDFISTRQLKFPESLLSLDISSNDIIKFDGLDFNCCKKFRYLYFIANSGANVEQLYSLLQKLESIPNFGAVYVDSSIIADNETLQQFRDVKLLLPDY